MNYSTNFGKVATFDFAASSKVLQVKTAIFQNGLAGGFLKRKDAGAGQAA